MESHDCRRRTCVETDVELLTPTEAARRLSLGRTRLYQLIGSGEIASVRVGKLRRIPARAVRAYVDGLVAVQVRSDLSAANQAIERLGEKC
jgi:excisionase family DNA binding protein